jgi:microcin C transport system substrate-binding protein
MATAGRALDRGLRAGHYWVPAWHNTTHRMAFWDVFAWPGQAPPYQRGVIDTWWSKSAE